MAAATEADVFWASHLNKAEVACVAQLRDVLRRDGQLADAHADDLTLQRFLRARKFDVAKAQLMYANMIKWRASQQLDVPDANFAFPEEALVRQHYPHFYHKTDKFGRPIYYELLGELNAVELMKATTVDRLVRYHIRSWERTTRHLMPACSRAVGRDVYTCVAIMDLQGFGRASFTSSVRSFLKEVSKLDQNNYPEHLGVMFIVNAPLVFSGVWALIKPMLEVRTQQKIHVLSSTKAMHAALMDIIPRENLLQRFGGDAVLEAPYYHAASGPWSADCSQGVGKQQPLVYSTSARIPAHGTVMA